MKDSQTQSHPGLTGDEQVESGPDTVDWNALYNVLADRVFHLLHRMTGDAEEAADLTHDVFVRVHESRHQYVGTGVLHAWVFRIAANAGRDALRVRQNRRSLAHHVVRWRLGWGAGAREPDHELSIGLERALATLDEAHRVVLLLHAVDGYKHREIGEMLGIAIGTSKARLSRARQTMREALEQGSTR